MSAGRSVCYILPSFIHSFNHSFIPSIHSFYYNVYSNILNHMFALLCFPFNHGSYHFWILSPFFSFEGVYSDDAQSNEDVDHETNRLRVQLELQLNRDANVLKRRFTSLNLRLIGGFNVYVIARLLTWRKIWWKSLFAASKFEYNKCILKRCVKESLCKDLNCPATFFHRNENIPHPRFSTSFPQTYAKTIKKDIPTWRKTQSRCLSWFFALFRVKKKELKSRNGTSHFLTRVCV